MFLRNFTHRKVNLNARLQGKIRHLVEEVEVELGVDYKTWSTARRCPACESGIVYLKRSSRSEFYGCSRYPACKHTENKPRKG
ncbi:topoisomerase DNA-binding C4 zinc finger domain-containing protein [Alteromonas sp. 14N.309.X.WAT.G.H12]|uniref:topoisomerase DNA-binding C4 zinc finger domain-containing protein n=1 Tax=Alteromonas sp. 14N.309.X.WAT.G.H12 TaxID=3120824 RepID=UPI003A5999A9